MKKNAKPIISIILTYHNRPQLVKRAISKILAQTIDNFELIIVDDCSKKPLILNKLFLKKNKIVYLRNRKNIGANRSRLRGLKLARGKYICFHDDDDYWMKTKLEKQFKFLEKNPKYYLASCFAKNKKKIIKFPINFNDISLSIYNCVGSFSIPMIRKNKILFSSLNNNLSNSQDWLVWKRMFKAYPFAIIPEVLVFFDDGKHKRISSRQDKHKYYSAYLEVALEDNKNKLVNLYHKSLSAYHCSENNFLRMFYGTFTLILRYYTKILIFLNK